MFSFRNIDNFVPGKFEQMGMLKGKRWYVNTSKKVIGLFKPQRHEFGNSRVFCANHYGELMGYMLADSSKIPSCKVELAHLSRYFKNIHKERNNGTPQAKNGCISYSDLKHGEELEHGKVVIDKLKDGNIEKYKAIISNDKYHSNDYNNDYNDNLEVIIASIEDRTRDFYNLQESYTSDEVEEKVAENRQSIIRTMVYDCLYGNNDRHDENWAMRKSSTDISLYNLYDNERVLGLYENQYIIEEALRRGKVEEVSENILFSRMRVPNEPNKHSNYKDVLSYLMQHYKTETSVALKDALENTTPEMVRGYLESCEGLPSCYVEFGSQMHRSRYEFAKNLYLNKDKNKPNIPQIMFRLDNLSATRPSAAEEAR